jgi:pilus assembly protein FimV
VKTTRATTHLKIGAKATLRGVAWRVGARSDSELKKTMLAIFRANPHAFEANINRLRLGAVLTIPSTAEISTISKDDANREVDAQMMTWSASSQKARVAAAPQITAAASTDASAALSAGSKAEGDAAESAALNLRLQSLEQHLRDMQGQLKGEHDKLLGMQSQLIYAEQRADDPVVAGPAPRQWLLTYLIGGLALMAGALGATFLKLRRRATPKSQVGSTVAGSAPTAGEPWKFATEPLAAEPVPRETARTVPQTTLQDAEPVFTAPKTEQAAPEAPLPLVNEEELRAAYEDTIDLSGETAILAGEMAAPNGDTANLAALTVNLDAQEFHAASAATAEKSTAGDESATSDESATATVMIGAEELQVDTTRLDYNLVDLDLTAQHVQMPSVLHERAVFKERRTNLVDVLKKAVEREPDRHDLRMKLLETYYAAAAANRQAFLEVVQKLARNRDRLAAGEWDKIALMGKQIASDTDLFSADSAEDDEKLADCA